MSVLNSKKELQIINLYIGCTLRLERLKQNLSQYEVGIKSGTDNTAVGRIERAEHFSSWSKIFLVCQSLNLNFRDLFVPVDKEKLLKIVEISYSLEQKLTAEKHEYYAVLKTRIQHLFEKE